MPVANQAFLQAEAPLAEGGVLGERSCFRPEALGNVGPGPGGPNSRFKAVPATIIVAAKGPCSTGHMGLATCVETHYFITSSGR